MNLSFHVWPLIEFRTITKSFEIIFSYPATIYYTYSQQRNIELFVVGACHVMSPQLCISYIFTIISIYTPDKYSDADIGLELNFYLFNIQRIS